MNADGTSPETARPFRRAVFYFAGFDNIGVRFYYGMFRRGMARASAREGRRAVVSKPAPAGEGIERWSIETSCGGRPVAVDYYFLSPRPIVHEFQSGNAVKALGAWAFTAFAFVRHGVLFRIFRNYWPAALVLTYALLAIPLYFLAGCAVGWILPRLFGPVAWPISAAAGTAGGFLGLQLGLSLDRRTFANYLLSAMRFSAAHALGRTAALERLCADWARFIGQHPDRKHWDEVLVVGHSTGASAAVNVIARLADGPQWGGMESGGKPISLLTLGSTDSIVSYFRSARTHRDALAKVATAPGVVWVEYYSPWDFISMGQHDPIADAGIELGGRVQRGPRLAMLDFREVLTPASYKRLRFDIFERHFQYLRAGDRVADYCYFRIVSAAKPLA